MCIRDRGERVVDIAARLKRSAAAIYEELKRGYTGEFDGYEMCIRDSSSPVIAASSPLAMTLS